MDKVPQCALKRGGGAVEESSKGQVVGLAVGDRMALSWSKHVRFQCIPAAQAYRVPDGVSFADAAFAHLATFPLAAIRKCRLEVGESALVMGQGVLGQMAVLLLRAAGAAPVLAADPDAAKRERARALGADAALDPTSADFAAQIRARCPSDRAAMGGSAEGAGPRVGIAVTGVGAALNGPLARGRWRSAVGLLERIAEVLGVRAAAGRADARGSHGPGPGWLNSVRGEAPHKISGGQPPCLIRL